MVSNEGFRKCSQQKQSYLKSKNTNQIFIKFFLVICFFCFQVLFGRIDAFNTLARLHIDILWLFFFFFLCFYNFQMKSSRIFPKGTLKFSSHGQIYIWFLFSVLQLVYIMKNVDWKIVPLLSKIDFTKDILQG